MAHQKSADRAANMLAEAGIRSTMPRMAVLTALLKAHRPVSAEDLANKLSDLRADEVTIYRILRMFAERGIAHQVDVGDRVWRFASCGDGHHDRKHAHFVCRKCGELECLDDDESGKIPDRPPPPGHVVEEEEVLLRGLCPECKSPITG